MSLLDLNNCNNILANNLYLNELQVNKSYLESISSTLYSLCGRFTANNISLLNIENIVSG